MARRYESVSDEVCIELRSRQKQKGGDSLAVSHRWAEEFGLRTPTVRDIVGYRSHLRESAIPQSERQNPIYLRNREVVRNKGRKARISKAIRKEVFENQDFQCRYCKADLRVAKSAIDHIVPVSAGGPSTLENLQALCFLCNMRKTNHPSGPSMEIYLENMRHFDSLRLEKQTRFLSLRNGATVEITNVECTVLNDELGHALLASLKPKPKGILGYRARTREFRGLIQIKVCDQCSANLRWCLKCLAFVCACMTDQCPERNASEVELPGRGTVYRNELH